jgi:hypothetical protein
MLALPARSGMDARVEFPSVNVTVPTDSGWALPMILTVAINVTA